MKLLMRQKYVDEAVGIYFPLGCGPNNTIDVNDGNRDVFEKLPRAVAEAVCRAHDEFRHKLYELLCEEPNK